MMASGGREHALAPTRCFSPLYRPAATLRGQNVPFLGWSLHSVITWR